MSCVRNGLVAGGITAIVIIVLYLIVFVIMALTNHSNNGIQWMSTLVGAIGFGLLGGILVGLATALYCK